MTKTRDLANLADLNFDSGTMVVDKVNDRVGIGTSSPSSTLDVEGSSDAKITIRTGNNTGYSELHFGDSDADNRGQVYYAHSTDSLSFVTSGSERLRIDSSGNVGIGTSSPNEKVTINGSFRAASQDWQMQILNPDTAAANKGGGIAFGGSYTGAVQTYFSNILGAKENGTAGNLAGYLSFYTRSSGAGYTAERMRIDSSGNLLVGKTASNVATEGAEIRSNGFTGLTVDGGAGLTIRRLTSDGELQSFFKDTTKVGSIGTKDSRLLIEGSQGATPAGIYFGGGGDVLPATGGNASDNNISLGGSLYRWKNLYLSGGVYLGGTGSANKLDDYEEGDFAPVYAIAGGSITTASNAGRYVKIGQFVFFTFRIRSSALSGTGVLTMTIPFATASENRSGGSQGYVRSWGADMPNFRFYVQPSASVITFYKNAMNAAASAVTGSDMDSGSDNNVLEGSIVYKSA